MRLVEDTFSSGEPPRRRSDGTSLQKSKPQPTCGLSGPLLIASLETGLMSARFRGLALRIASHEVSGRRKSLEVFGFQWGLKVDAFQQTMRFRPRPSRECVAGSPERLDVCHVTSSQDGRSLSEQHDRIAVA